MTTRPRRRYDWELLAAVAALPFVYMLAYLFLVGMGR